MATCCSEKTESIPQSPRGVPPKARSSGRESPGSSQSWRPRSAHPSWQPLPISFQERLFGAGAAFDGFLRATRGRRNVYQYVFMPLCPGGVEGYTNASAAGRNGPGRRAGPASAGGRAPLGRDVSPGALTSAGAIGPAGSLGLRPRDPGSCDDPRRLRTDRFHGIGSNLLQGTFIQLDPEPGLGRDPEVSLLQLVPRHETPLPLRPAGFETFLQEESRERGDKVQRGRGLDRTEGIVVRHRGTERLRDLANLDAGGEAARVRDVGLDDIDQAPPKKALEVRGCQEPFPERDRS